MADVGEPEFDFTDPTLDAEDDDIEADGIAEGIAKRIVIDSEDEEEEKPQQPTVGFLLNNDGNPNTGSEQDGARPEDDGNNANAGEDKDEEGQNDADGVGANEDEDKIIEALPEHACAYCGIHQPGSVVHCNTCNKWFCNGRGGTAAAHIVTHLVRSRHKEVSLHKESAMGDAVLECYACGCRNAFLLGFVRSKSQNVVVLLCRVCIEASNQAALLKDADWNVAQWETILQERVFLSWLVTIPSAQDQNRARHLTREQIHKLEDMWKDNPDAVFEDLDKPGTEDALSEVLVEYDDAYQYQRIFTPLIKLESDDDKKTKELQTQTGVKVVWRVGPNGKHQAYFFFSKLDSDLRLVAGDELRLKHSTSSWECVGQVVRTLPSEEICVELKGHATPPGSVTQALADAGDEGVTAHGFSVEYVWKSVSFDRMQTALRRFALNQASVGENVYRRLLGQDKEDRILPNALPHLYSAPGLPELNHSQVCAVKAVLQRPLSLIQGPPGTGKTVTSATIVYHMVKVGQQKSSEHMNKKNKRQQWRKPQVLVCAPSNVAVDQLTEKINATGLSVVRLAAKSRESIDSSVDFLTLHRQIESLVYADKGNSGQSEFSRLAKKLEEEGGLSAAEERKFRNFKRNYEKDLLKAADVICCTCVGAGDPRLGGLKFKYVLVDEATQATEPECLIPLVCGATQVVLVGDHCQLGPVIMCKKAAKAGLTQSMFERLIKLGMHPIRLQVQYRMHPLLSTFPSNEFYEGSLQNGVTMQERTSLNVDFPWTHTSRPMVFWHLTGNEEISVSGTSYLNRTEAAACEKVVTQLLRCGVTPNQIGVITPYEGQRAHIITSLAHNGPLRTDLYKDIEVASVDAVQGREKDYIILSCVRSNDYQGIGFLRDPRRLNVSITRARYGLIILGNARVLAKQQLWYNLIMHFRSCGCLVEGTLSHLKTCMLKFAPPKIPKDTSTIPVAPEPIEQTHSLGSSKLSSQAMPYTFGGVSSDGSSNYTPYSAVEGVYSGLYGMGMFSRPLERPEERAEE